MLEIVKKGPMTTVQDAGRTGHQAEGVRPSGACDPFAFGIANRLAGNPPDAAALEFTLSGGAVRFTRGGCFAFSGADMPLTLNGRMIEKDRCHAVSAGDVLEIGMARAGLRGYLAVGGGIDTAPCLGSRSSEKPPETGEIVPAGGGPFRPRRADADALRKTASRVRLTDGGAIPVLRYVPGPQEERFEPADFDRNIYTVRTDSDRMGVRMDGEALASGAGYDILSDGIAPGAIQISGGGLPVVMQAAHQTTGGYAKIGTVITADLKVLAQLRPGERVCFSRVTPDEARAYLINERQRMEEIGHADDRP